MTKENKELILRWFKKIAQMAEDRKTEDDSVMDDVQCLDEIKVLAKEAAEFIEYYLDCQLPPNEFVGVVSKFN